MAGRDILDRRTFVRGALLAGGTMISGFMLVGCGAGERGAPAGSSGGTSSSAGVQASISIDPSRTLVAYFTCPEPTGTDTVAGASRVVRDGRVYGNLELVATLIAERTGSDLFAIETVQEYPADHDELIAFAVEEMDAGTLPELAGHIQNLDGYDTVLLGYPIWNAQLPMPVRSLLEECDFSGKTIVPFTVHGGSGFGGTLNQLEAAEPDATIAEGFSVSRNAVGDVDEDLNAWIDGMLSA